MQDNFFICCFQYLNYHHSTFITSSIYGHTIIIITIVGSKIPDLKDTPFHITFVGFKNNYRLNGIKKTI